MLQNTNIIQELGSCYKRIAELEKVLRAIVEMIDDCPDGPKKTDSLPQAIRFYADGALRGIDTGVK